MRSRLFSRLVASSVLIFFLAGATALHGDDDTGSFSFDVAPPPVGYPRIEKGFRDVTVGGQGILARGDILDTTFTITGITLFGSLQTNPLRRTMFNLTGGGALLAGDRMGLVTSRVPLRILGAVQTIDSDYVDLYIFAAAGGDVGVTRLTVTVPQPIPYTTSFVEDDTTLSIVTTSGTVQIGGQVNVETGPFITSLFAVWSYTGGTYSTSQNSSMSYDYPSSSGDLEASSAIAGGVDLLWKERSIALSSQIRNSHDFMVYTLAVKRLLGSP